MFGENSVPGPGFFPKILAGLLVVLGLDPRRHRTS